MTNDPGGVSVVMPVRNGAALLDTQLASLAAQNYAGRWEVVVVDNGSTDGTARVAERWRGRLPDLRVHHASEARGANHARNAGCRAATGDRFAFCDHDDVADPGWLTALTRGLEAYPMVGGFLERESLSDAAAVASRPQRHRLHDGGFGFLPYPLTANCAMHRAVWETLGGFNGAFQYGSDDVEFFWRAQLAGFALGYVPDAVMHYRLRRDLAGMARQYYDYGRSHPRLYRAFRGAGMPRNGVRAGGRGWLELAGQLPALARSRPARAVWVTRAAMRWGRLVGSARHGVVYL
jgi:glycosyltransferase involved in cell wall biosynthesis